MNRPSAKPNPSHRGRLIRDQRGTAMVELAIVLMGLLPFVLVTLACAELLLDYHHVAAASRAAARYATRSEVDPATGTRRPTTAQVAAFGSSAAAPLSGVSVSLTNGSGTAVDNLSGRPGDEVTVQIDGDSTNPGWSLVSGFVDNVASVFGLKPLPPSVHLRSSTTAVYE